MSALGGLSRRERQIMEILYQRGKASASEVREAMEDAPGYSAVRAMLRVLEEKGHVKHQAEGCGTSTCRSSRAKRPSARPSNTCWTHSSTGLRSRSWRRCWTSPRPRLTNEELDRMAQMIEKARREGK